jgi:hypothetical protein
METMRLMDEVATRVSKDAAWKALYDLAKDCLAPLYGGNHATFPATTLTGAVLRLRLLSAIAPGAPATARKLELRLFVSQHVPSLVATIDRIASRRASSNEPGSKFIPTQEFYKHLLNTEARSDVAAKLFGLHRLVPLDCSALRDKGQVWAGARRFTFNGSHDILVCHRNTAQQKILGGLHHSVTIVPYAIAVSILEALQSFDWHEMLALPDVAVRVADETARLPGDAVALISSGSAFSVADVLYQRNGQPVVLGAALAALDNVLTAVSALTQARIVHANIGPQTVEWVTPDVRRTEPDTNSRFRLGGLWRIALGNSTRNIENTCTLHETEGPLMGRISAPSTPDEDGFVRDCRCVFGVFMVLACGSDELCLWRYYSMISILNDSSQTTKFVSLMHRVMDERVPPASARGDLGDLRQQILAHWGTTKMFGDIPTPAAADSDRHVRFRDDRESWTPMAALREVATMSTANAKTIFPRALHAWGTLAWKVAGGKAHGATREDELLLQALAAAIAIQGRYVRPVTVPREVFRVFFSAMLMRRHQDRAANANELRSNSDFAVPAWSQGLDGQRCFFDLCADIELAPCPSAFFDRMPRSKDLLVSNSPPLLGRPNHFFVLAAAAIAPPILPSLQFHSDTRNHMLRLLQQALELAFAKNQSLLLDSIDTVHAIERHVCTMYRNERVLGTKEPPAFRFVPSAPWPSAADLNSVVVEYRTKDALAQLGLLVSVTESDDCVVVRGDAEMHAQICAKYVSSADTEASAPCRQCGHPLEVHRDAPRSSSKEPGDTFSVAQQVSWWLAVAGQLRDTSGVNVPPRLKRTVVPRCDVSRLWRFESEWADEPKDPGGADALRPLYRTEEVSIR